MTTPPNVPLGQMKSISSRNYAEKRNFIRMRIDTNVSFTTENGRETYIGRCRNLSGTGMLIETDKKLRIGNTVTITLPSERSELPNLEALAEVIRIEQKPEARTYEVGLAIKSMF